MREHSDWDFKSAVFKSAVLEDFLVGDVTGSKGFLMVGDFLGEKEWANPDEPSLVVEFEWRGGDVLDLEGGLAMGFGSLAFSGEVELLAGCLVLGFDFNSSVALEDRFRSRSFKNLGKEGFLCELWSPKFISHAWGCDDGLPSSESSLFRVSLGVGCSLSCPKSMVKDRF